MSSTSEKYSSPIRERFIQALESQRLNQSTLARLFGVKPQRLSNIYRNGSQPDPDLLSLAIDKIGVNGTWLLTGEGPMFRDTPQSNAAFVPGSIEFIDVPFVDKAYAYLSPAGTLDTVSLDNLPTIKVYKDPSWKTSPTIKILAVTAKGDSMEPMIIDGDTLIIQEVPSTDFEYLSKGVYLFITSDYQVVKRITTPPLRSTETIDLLSDNSAFPTLTVRTDAILAIYTILQLQRSKVY